MVELKPKSVFDCFAQINQVPRPSKREEKITAFLRKFGEDLGLETIVDHAGNVLIKKPATPGYENRKTVILQSHQDMVCEKNKEVEFDFDNDAIQTYVDGEWLKAKGTTLGADDGIGIAMEMALLQATDIEHGPIECVFTRDEETGLTGAFEMKSDFMSGDILINLDSEDEGEIFVSCAGGVRTEAKYDLELEAIPAGYKAVEVTIKGLTGGHSGDDINKKRGNANKILVRFLLEQCAKTDLRLCDILAGGLHNAIPREAHAIVVTPSERVTALIGDLCEFGTRIKEEFSSTEPDVMFLASETNLPSDSLTRTQTERILKSLSVVHNGIFAMSQDIDDLVETSSNLANIKREGNQIIVNTSQRSSVASNLTYMAEVVRAAFELGGAKCVTNEGYPGWKVNPKSEIVKVAVASYKRLFKKEPKVRAIHAGLECGLFSEKYPNLDMVSFGPTLRGVHSPDERLLIPTVQMVWDHLLDILKNVPNA